MTRLFSGSLVCPCFCLSKQKGGGYFFVPPPFFVLVGDSTYSFWAMCESHQLRYTSLSTVMLIYRTNMPITPSFYSVQTKQAGCFASDHFSRCSNIPVRSLNIIAYTPVFVNFSHFRYFGGNEQEIYRYILSLFTTVFLG